MGLINKIRERSGLAVGLVALGLGFFMVGSDILGPNSVLLGNNKTDVGEIDGRLIDVKEYQKEIDQIKYKYTLQYRRNPSENEMYTIQQQAWDYLIVKIAFQNQYDDLGLVVTEDEQWDMIQGKNVIWEIRQSFTNPATGQFDREAVVNYLKTVKDAPPEQQASWYMFEENLRPSRLRIKYDNLLVKTVYATEAESVMQYDKDNTVAEIDYLYVPYYSVSDTAIEITDSDLEAYLDAHQAEYQVKQSRDFDYISVPVIPSSTDTASFITEVEGLVDDFKQSTEDSLFARINSDGARYYETYTIDQLPSMLQANVANLSSGDVRGPYFVEGKITLYKISDIVQDTAYSAKASHILIKWKDESSQAKNDARKKAQNLLSQLRTGADFAMLARQNSEDGSAQNGGDLGWFTEGRMVKPFETAVFNATRLGLVNRIIESQFGYHIINVTGLKTNTSILLASIERDITPSDETRNKAFRKADYFASATKSFDDFIENAEKDSLKILKATGVGPNDRSFNEVGNSRSVIQWAYNDGEIGKISPVKELDDQYIIAVLTNITEAGPAELEDVRDQIVIKVKNEKKSVIIIDKIKNASGTLNEIADLFGDESGVYSSSDLKFSSNSLPVIGTAPIAIGTAFGLKDGEISKPVKEESGIVVIEMKALTKAPEIADYNSSKTKVEQQASGRMSYGISEAIKKNASIKDERYRYF